MLYHFITLLGTSNREQDYPCMQNVRGRHSHKSNKHTGAK